MNMKILVTGATGFIGSHLVKALLKRGNSVRCLVEEHQDISALTGIDAECIRGDLLRRETAVRAVKDIQIVYHLAAKVRPSRWIEKIGSSKNLYRDINVLGTRNLAEACSAARVERFVHFSSISAAGPSAHLTEDAPSRPLTDYGISKREGENVVLSCVRSRNLPAVVLRPSSVYGPGNKALLFLLKMVSSGVCFTVGSGTCLVPLCYIDDVIEAAVAAGTKGRVGEIYFVSERSYSYRAIVGEIAAVFGKRVNIIPIPYMLIHAAAALKDKCEEAAGRRVYPFCVDVSAGSIKTAGTEWSCCTEKARSELGFEPRVELAQGIRLTIEWCVKKGLL
jgi:dihydroflavonol-4-reductase